MKSEISAPLQESAKSAQSAVPFAFLFIGLIAFVLLLFAGVLVFSDEDSMVRGSKMSRDRAIFTVVNAATLTGFQQTSNVGEYRWPGQAAVFVLIIGGSLFTMIVGGVAVVRIVGLPYSTKQIIYGALIFEGLAILVGTALLFQPGGSFFAAIFQAASAVGNAGHWIGTLPDLEDWRLHGVLLVLSVLGGLGLPVVMEVAHLLPARKTLTSHSRQVLTMTAGVYLASLIVLTLVARLNADEVGREAIIASSAAALNARTPGFPLGLPDMRSMQWVLIALMIIGGSPAGTAGGIKTTTLATLAAGVRRALRGDAVGRAFGIALVWLASYALIAFVSLVLLLWTEPQLPGDRVLFIVISALSNVGLSHDPVSVVKSGLHILSVTMLLGRILPLVILWWMAATVTTQSRRDEVAVG